MFNRSFNRRSSFMDRQLDEAYRQGFRDAINEGISSEAVEYDRKFNKLIKYAERDDELMGELEEFNEYVNSEARSEFGDETLEDLWPALNSSTQRKVKDFIDKKFNEYHLTLSRNDPTIKGYNVGMMLRSGR